MQYDLLPGEAERIAEARNSFSGNLLTDRQFDDFMAATGMMKRRIEEAGSFIDPLRDLSNAIARNERYITPDKADTIIRDLFKIRYGMTMNNMLEGLIETENKLFDSEGKPSLEALPDIHYAVEKVSNLVQNGTKMTFHRALSEEAASLASDLGITHFGAKSLIAESVQSTDGRTLSEWGKELDETYYRPQIEAEKKQRATKVTRRRSYRASYS